MWTWGWLPTVRFAASQWRQRIFIVARNIRSGSGPTANRGSILMCIYLVFRTFLYYVTMISSAWLMELWALPYPFGPTVVQPKARLVRAASSVETSHHCDLFWNILIQVPSLSFICCADHGSVDFNVNIIEIDLFRHLFRCCNVLQSRALWCAGSDPGASIDSSTHRLIDSSTRHHSLNWFDWFDSWTRHLWFELCTFEPRVPQLCWRRHCNALNVYVPVLYVWEMSTLQCSIYCAGFKKLRYQLKSQGADMMCQNSQVSAAGWRASTSRSIDGCPCRGLWWNLLNS